MTHPSAPAIQPATRDDEDAVAHLFEALHMQNAALDERFALALGWRAVLHRHFVRTRNAPGACWRLAWSNTEPVGLIVLEAHTDSPLFRYRHWAELVALYVTPPYRGSGLADRLIAEGRDWPGPRIMASSACNSMSLPATRPPTPAIGAAALCPYNRFCAAICTLHQGIQPPADPSCALTDADRGDALETGQHHLAMELERNGKERP